MFLLHLQISTDCPGTTYGRLFHQLLLERGLLLHRAVLHQIRPLLSRVIKCALFVLHLQISTDCPGTTYGRLFHQLLLERGLLLLGLYRPVQQGGLNFRATITNPRYVRKLACCVTTSIVYS
jgi:hypothetical protein